MKAAAEKAGKLLMIGFVRRYGNDCAVLKDFIGNDYFGDIYYAKATYLRRNGSPGGWLLLTVGAAVVTFGYHLFGLLENAHGVVPYQWIL